MISQRQAITEDSNQPPRLLVVVDTEEEFPWDRPADRSNTGVTHMRNIEKVQSVCDEYGLKPCYVSDYPVVTQSHGVEALREISESGRCEIGAHLHPWVSPPLVEKMEPANTYPGNLDAAVEGMKLETLVAAIESAFGLRPVAYKAGRYGFGPNTARLIEQLGFRIDLSFSPAIDHSEDGGPDYSDEQCDPFWFGDDFRMLEIPITSAFIGWSGALAKKAYAFGQAGASFKLPALLSRTRAVDRLVLSPEGFDFDEHQRLTQSLLTRGTRTFTWSFHSPSVEVGHTPYVRSKSELENFLDKFKRYFDYFFGELGGVATTPATLYDDLEANT